MEAHNIVVVGGNNVDINATSLTQLVYGDSNPGNIYTGLGGVGRNIAENLIRMGQKVSLISVFGDDEFSRLAQAQAKRIGMDLSDSIFVSNAPSCVYVCINEPSGEMAVAVNDMELCNRITPEFLAAKLDKLNAADGIVIDANISEAAIDFLVQHCSVPMFADAVSAKKASRLHRSLPHLKALKSNQIEVELLTGLTISHEHAMTSAAQTLHQMGVELVLITLGSRGAFASDGNTHLFEHPFSQHLINTTGCGDAFMAATVIGILERRTLNDILRMGLAAATLCGMSEQAVSEQMSMQAIEGVLQGVQSTQEANV
ncbi:MAG TPA: carbohydrate kinase family protein [Candidatus Limiplasma sp.]|nr:carbohydrate kinase family protein [Candidatus Limiplasma sp.]HPS81564.1 carbohydrate kinase family protein [Candidatus Limiplasma sp.]